MPLLELRRVEVDDHPWLVSLHNDPVVLHNLTDPTPITFENHLRWWCSLPASEQRLVFTVDRVRAGFCKFYKVDQTNRNCSLGADLHSDFRGRGLAAPMWHLMLAHCFDVLHLHRVSLTTAVYNKVAQHVYRKVGFKEEGRLVESLLRDGEFHDQIAMYMLRNDYQKEIT